MINSKLGTFLFTIAISILFNSVDVWAKCVEGDCTNGLGTFKEAYGDWVYEGNFVQGDRHGKGKLTWASGDVYKGDFTKDAIMGKGKFTMANSDVYEGDWVDNKRTGKGKLTWTSGDVYEGDWVDDKRTGKGKLTWASGSVYEGDWRNGARIGQGTYTSSSGTKEEQIWNEGSQYTRAEWNAKMRDEEREFQEAERIRMAEKEISDKRDKIFNACYLDKIKGADISSFRIRRAVEKVCDSIADDPSWLESLKYD